MELTRNQKEEKDQINLNRFIDKHFKFPLNPLQEALYSWFLFALSNRGSGFNNFSAEDFNSFQKELSQMLKELYKVNHSARNCLDDGKEDTK
jgi:hypothetical protein